MTRIIRITRITIAVALVGIAACGRLGFDESNAMPRCPIGPDPGWSLAPGFRAAVITDTLDEPTAVTFAGGAFGDRLFVTSNATSRVTAFDPRTGASTPFVDAAAWAVPPAEMTAMIWDADGVFDGALYLADRGSSDDGDSAIHAIDASGATRMVARPPGPALDDVYSLAFVDDAGYGTGLFVAGDTDGETDDWARYAAAGGGTPFSSVAGVSGVAVDTSNALGGGVFAARPSNASFAGDDAIVKVSEAGEIIYTLAADLDDAHAAVIAPEGELHGWIYVATQTEVIRVDAAGEATTIVAGADFDTLDGNVIAFGADGDAMYVVSRTKNALVCIEPTGEPPGALPDAAPPPPPGGGAAGD